MLNSRNAVYVVYIGENKSLGVVLTEDADAPTLTKRVQKLGMLHSVSRPTFESADEDAQRRSFDRCVGFARDVLERAYLLGYLLAISLGEDRRRRLPDEYATD